MTMDENRTSLEPDKETLNCKAFPIKKILILILLLCCLPYLIFFSFYGIVEIESNSMSPTLAMGSRYITTKISDKDPLKRGDIVIHQLDPAVCAEHLSEKKGYSFANRILAVPGDTMEINNNGEYLINGKRLRHNNYILRMSGSPKTIPHSLLPQYNKRLQSPIPNNFYFCVGDKGIDVLDSRYYGLIARKHISATFSAKTNPWHKIPGTDNTEEATTDTIGNTK